MASPTTTTLRERRETPTRGAQLAAGTPGAPPVANGAGSRPRRTWLDLPAGVERRLSQAETFRQEVTLICLLVLLPLGMALAALLVVVKALYGTSTGGLIVIFSAASATGTALGAYRRYLSYRNQQQTDPSHTN